MSHYLKRQQRMIDTMLPALSEQRTVVAKVRPESRSGAPAKSGAKQRKLSLG